MLKKIVILAAALLITSSSFAVYKDSMGYSEQFPLIADIEASRVVYSTGVQPAASLSSMTWNVTNQVTLADGTTVHNDGSVILVFVLPDRQGQVIAEADLRFWPYYLYRGLGVPFDCYGLRYVPQATAKSSVVQASDMFNDFYGNDPSATAIDKNIIDPNYFLPQTDANKNLGTAWQGLTDQGNLALRCWLNSLYDNGAVAGDYALIRINPEFHTGSYANLQITNSNIIDSEPRINFSLRPANDPSLQACPPVYRNLTGCRGVAGDLTGDCKVTLADVYVIVQNWMRCDKAPSWLCNQ